MDSIPYGRHDIDQSDVDAVVEVLRSKFLTQGDSVPAFELAVAAYCGSKYALALNSATSALHLACLALGVSKGDIVWTTPITFVASANCALYCGANVDFVDIDPFTFNMSLDALSEKLSIAEQEGRLPKVVIPVHLCGQSSDMQGLYRLSKRYGFKIIEDASHAIGGKYLGKPIGSCEYSDITIFSFHPVKIITTGEGGMVVTNQSDIARKVKILRTHGITNSPEDMIERPIDEIWNYQQINLGFNYRMTDIQGALGVSQMRRLDAFVERRNAIANQYIQKLQDLPLVEQKRSEDSYSSYHLYAIRMKLRKAGKRQIEVFRELQAAGVMVNLHYIPVYRHPYYEGLGFRAGHCPEAERYYSEALSIPIYPALTEQQQDYIVETMNSILSK